MKQIKRGVRKDDEFVTAIQKIAKYIVRHRETSIWIGVVLILGISGLIYFLSTGEQQNPQADLLHTQAMGYMSVGKVQEAENTLLTLIQKYSNTRPGEIGYYYLGVLCYHTGRFDSAMQYFDEFLGREKHDHILSPSALFGAGCAAEGLKDYEKALNYYARIVQDKKSPFYYEGMLAYGRVHGIVGNIAKAKEILEELLKQNPSNDIAADARFYLGYFNQ